MPDRHEQRGFEDGSRIDTIPVRAFETSSMIGKTIESQKPRETELAAEELIEDGKPHEATDTKGEWKAQGLKQCKVCNVAKDERKEFRILKIKGVEYRSSYCRECETNNTRTNRFSNVLPVRVYPQYRVE